ncbi:hypothetical protein QTP88_011420 [Uroleucon formosanum]
MENTRLTFSDPTWTSVDALESILGSLSGGVLVCAAVNALSALWHDCKSDTRGEIVVDFISRKDLKVHNVAGFPPTFKNRGSACLDVTLTRNYVRVTDWSVSHDPTSSDHTLTSFDTVAKNDARVSVQDTVTRYNWRRTDWVQFRKTLKTYRDTRISDLDCPDVETSSRALTELLTQACEKHVKALVYRTWKNARLVVIRKSPNKDPSEAKSYRPISLLPVILKALKHVIVQRIRAITEDHMSKRQYGFTKNLSTVDAIQHALAWKNDRPEKYIHAVFFDITGAFDCLWWPQLIKDMRSAKCSEALIELTKSYLDDQHAETRIDNEYGPDLWKLAVNPLLVEDLPGGTELIAYADDLAILVSGKNRAELTAKTNAVLEKVTQWANQRKLTFSAAKLQTFWFKRLLSKPLYIWLGGVRFKSTPTANTHLAEKVEGTKALFSRLYGVRKTNWGLKSGIPLRLYKVVFVPQMGYVATATYSAQRIPLLAIIGAYKTTSTHALQVLAGVPPLDLQLKEQARIVGDMVALRRFWQHRWVNSEKGRWTARWFPCVCAWLERVWYDAACRCGSPTGTAEHLLFDCLLADKEREKLRIAVQAAGANWPCNLEFMTKSDIMFQALQAFAHATLNRPEEGKPYRFQRVDPWQFSCPRTRYQRERGSSELGILILRESEKAPLETDFAKVQAEQCSD